MFESNRFSIDIVGLVVVTAVNKFLAFEDSVGG